MVEMATLNDMFSSILHLILRGNIIGHRSNMVRVFMELGPKGLG